MNKMVTYLKDNIFARIVRKIWYSVGAPFVHKKAVLYNKRISASSAKTSSRVNVTVASEADINESYEDMWHSKENALKKLRNGDILFLAKDNNVNIFYGWAELSYIEIPYLGVGRTKIPRDVAYLSGFYVPSSSRNKGITGNCLKYIEKYLAEQTTAKYLFCITSPDNSAINKVFLSSGYTPYQFTDLFKIFGLYIYVITTFGDKAAGEKRVFMRNANMWNVFSGLLDNDGASKK
jgi:hypothetical protein